LFPQSGKINMIFVIIYSNVKVSHNTNILVDFFLKGRQHISSFQDLHLIVKMSLVQLIVYTCMYKAY
jgi:hypothetical protein